MYVYIYIYIHMYMYIRFINIQLLLALALDHPCVFDRSPLEAIEALTKPTVRPVHLLRVFLL